MCGCCVFSTLVFTEEESRLGKGKGGDKSKDAKAGAADSSHCFRCKIFHSGVTGASSACPIHSRRGDSHWKVKWRLTGVRASSASIRARRPSNPAARAAATAGSRTSPASCELRRRSRRSEEAAYGDRAKRASKQTGLAEAWRSRVAGQAAENTERLEAENAQGRVRGVRRVRGCGLRVRGGEQCVLSMPSGAVLLACVPAHGLEGAQAGVYGGTAMSVGES